MRDVVIKPVENDEELRQANDLMAKAHLQDYLEASEWLSTFGAEYPDFRREHTRIAMFENEVVGALRITTDTIRIGESRLKIGGLGWVSTAGPWRRKGVGAQIVSDALKYMKEHRYHISMLFGIPAFYHRWGFATTLVEYSSTIELKEIAKGLPLRSYKIRGVKPGDIPTIQRMHLLNDSEIACSLIRTQAHMANRWGRWRSVRVLSDNNGKVIAYFRGTRNRQEYVIDEMGVANCDACPILLHAVAGQAHEEYAVRIRFCAPPNHPILCYLLQHPSAYEMKTYHNSSGMMALVNLEETLESMIPEWEDTLGKSALARSHAEITLLVGKSPIRIRANRAAIFLEPGMGINKVLLSSQELVQLLTGYCHLDEALASKRRIVNADGMELLRLIFPKRLPYVWMIDRF